MTEPPVDKQMSFKKKKKSGKMGFIYQSFYENLIPLKEISLAQQSKRCGMPTLNNNKNTSSLRLVSSTDLKV